MVQLGRQWLHNDPAAAGAYLNSAAVPEPVRLRLFPPPPQPKGN